MGNEEAIARLEQRMDSFEKENERRNAEMQRAIESIEAEQEKARERDHCGELTMGDMKKDIETILKHINSIGPRRNRTATIGIAIGGLILAGVQVAAMVQGNQIARMMLELSSKIK